MEKEENKYLGKVNQTLDLCNMTRLLYGTRWRDLRDSFFLRTGTSPSIFSSKRKGPYFMSEFIVGFPRNKAK